MRRADFWFIPATHISIMVRQGAVSPNTAFVAFLVGVCVIATGLTFLETIANPYTTVLGDPRYAATRINLAQSCNGIGWIFGPIVGSMFFYSKDAMGRSTGSETLYIPYVAIAVVVIVLAVIFYFANVPDIKTEDDYHLDDSTPGVSHSIWSHPHFVAGGCGAVLLRRRPGRHLQLLHQLHDRRSPRHSRLLGRGHDQAGRQRRFPAATGCQGWFEVNHDGVLAISDKGASNLASLGFVCFLVGPLQRRGLLRKFSAHKMLGLYGAAERGHDASWSSASSAGCRWPACS